MNRSQQLHFIGHPRVHYFVFITFGCAAGEYANKSYSDTPRGDDSTAT
jgi:hypothetical protein